MWSEAEKKFSEEAVQITTNLWKLRAEVEERSQENESLKTELAKKESGMKELQTQMAMVKIEVQVQKKQQKNEKRSWMNQISKSLI